MGRHSSRPPAPSLLAVGWLVGVALWAGGSGAGLETGTGAAAHEEGSREQLLDGVGACSAKATIMDACVDDDAAQMITHQFDECLCNVTDQLVGQGFWRTALLVAEQCEHRGLDFRASALKEAIHRATTSVNKLVSLVSQEPSQIIAPATLGLSLIRP